MPKSNLKLRQVLGEINEIQSIIHNAKVSNRVPGDDTNI